MKQPRAISPSSLALWQKDKIEFYRRYLCDTPLGRNPQTYQMAVGSAFDAYVKSHLYAAIVGNDGTHTFEQLFETQVEPQNRDRARKDGAVAFEAYKLARGLEDLLALMQGCLTVPKFETSVDGKVKIGDCEIPFTGKPDLYFRHRSNIEIIHDWKVNGFYSKASPQRGYIMLRDGWIGPDHSKNHNRPHKDAFATKYKDVTINTMQTFEEVDVTWANQLCIYSWLIVGVNEEVLCSIDQLACDGPSRIMLAQHRGRFSKDFNVGIMKAATEMWTTINSDHIFRDLSKEQSQSRCKLLDQEGAALANPTTENEKWLKQIVQSNRTLIL